MTPGKDCITAKFTPYISSDLSDLSVHDLRSLVGCWLKLLIFLREKKMSLRTGDQTGVHVSHIE